MASALLDISYRDIPLYSTTQVRGIDEAGGFLETTSPMPVGTLLILSPVDNPDLRIPARVATVVEACRAADPQGRLSGMRLRFEGDGESLLPYLQADDGPAASPEPPEPEDVDARRALHVASLAYVAPSSTSPGFAAVALEPPAATAPEPEPDLEPQIEPAGAPDEALDQAEEARSSSDKIVLDEEQLAGVIVAAPPEPGPADALETEAADDSGDPDDETANGGEDAGEANGVEANGDGEGGKRKRKTRARGRRRKR